MTTSVSRAIGWIVLFIIIYVLFMTRNKEGYRHANLGVILLLMNAMAGFYLADEVSAFIAMIVTGVYAISYYSKPDK